jgi:hypothetical protein
MEDKQIVEEKEPGCLKGREEVKERGEKDIVLLMYSKKYIEAIR